MIKATIKGMGTSMLLMLFVTVLSSTTFAQNMMYGDNVVVDGDFSGDALPASWGSAVDAGTGTVAVVDGEAAITGLGGQANSWDVQLFQVLTEDQIAALSKGGDWELTFDARTTVDSTKTFHVFLGNNQAGGDWARYWNDNYTFTTDTTIRLTVKIDQTWPEMKLGFEVAHDSKDIFLDNIVLRKYDDNILYDGGLVIGEDSISAAWNLVSNGNQATYSVDNGAVKISDFVNVVNSYDVQMIQELDPVQIDSIYAGPYEMFFDARTEASEKQIQVFFGNNGTDGDWTNFAPTLVLDDTMKTYSLIVNPTTNWSMMKIGFEVSGDNSAVWFDNVIVRRVRDIPPAAPEVSVTTNNGFVTIAVTPVEGAATYDVYFADSTFVDSDGGSLVGTIDGTAGETTYIHTTVAPHPSLVESFMAYYGVIAKKENGTASAMTSASIQTEMSVSQHMIVEVDEASGNAILGAVASETMPTSEEMMSYFPTGYNPFELNSSSKTIEGSAPDDDADLSAKFWVGHETFSGADFLIIYAEITDDVLVAAPSTGENPGGAAWNYDTWEMGISAYSPPSFVNGSDHQDFERGDEPDYQLRAGYFNDESLFINAYSGSGGVMDQAVPNSQTIGETSETGYRLLTILSTIEFSGIELENKNFDFPTGTEVTTVPFNIALNDNDDAARETQVTLGPKTTNSWWNTPAQWNVVAMVGADAFIVANEDEVDTTPFEFSLEQNYPNPFNPSTQIEFSLANASNVTLEVYNMLGQKVATLLQNEKMSAGHHAQTFTASQLASGMYVYRITAGNFVQTRKMMLIK